MTLAVRRVLGPTVFAGLGLLAAGLSGSGASRAAAHAAIVQRALASTAGWADAAARLQDALGRWNVPAVSESPTPALWAAQRLQQAVAQTGIHVSVLEPTAPAEAIALLKTTTTGPAPVIAAWLQRLPDWLPGLSLDVLDLTAQDGGLECRLELTVPAPPGGGGSS